MRKKSILSIATILLLISIQSIAASKDDLATSCEDTLDLKKMTTCAEKVYKTSNKQLDKQYQNVRKLLNSKSEKWLLHKAYTKWKTFRESYCKFATYAIRKEPGFSFHKHDCLDRVTQQYIEILEKYVEDLDV
jgi:uncharacterized protein YecT (DUF1311 family)